MEFLHDDDDIDDDIYGYINLLKFIIMFFFSK